jgi:hypothetical protein
MPDTPITFEDVELLEDSGLAWHVRIQGKVVIVGRARPLQGTTIRSPGNRGRLVLPRWAVEDLGLTEPTA